MDITADLKKIALVLDDTGAISTVKQMPLVSVLLVECPCVVIHNRLHYLPDRITLCSQFQMEMICHQAVCMQDKRIPFLHFPQEHQEYCIVFFSTVYRAVPVPSCHDMIAGPFVPLPFLSRLSFTSSQILNFSYRKSMRLSI